MSTCAYSYVAFVAFASSAKSASCPRQLHGHNPHAVGPLNRNHFGWTLRRHGFHHRFSSPTDRS